MGFKTEGNTLVKYIDDGETDIVIPYGIEKIEIDAFKDCENIESIVIPDSVKYIGNGAFDGCANLEKVEMPDSIEQIGMMTFYGCVNLKSVRLPENLKRIGNSAFSDCESLCNISLPESVEFIGKSAFEGCRNLLSIKIPDKVEEIKEFMFYRCEKLRNVYLNENIKKIGDFAFAGCESLCNISLPESLEIIGNSAFDCCMNFVSINIPSKLKEIKKYAFGNCTSLNNLKIPNSLKRIDECAFYNSNFEYIEISTNTFLEKNAFKHCIFHKIRIKDNISYITAYSSNFSVLWAFMTADPNSKEHLFEITGSENLKKVFALYLVSAFDSTKAHRYIRKNIVDTMKYFIDKEEAGSIIKILSFGYVTAENIDEMIEYAIATKKAEMQVILMNYKNDNFGFKDNFDDLLID